MNKLLHALVLVFFTGACWFLALMLKLPLMVQATTPRLPSVRPGEIVLPAFTRLCMAAGPILLAALALSAVAYCIYVWTRKAGSRATWIGFLATAMSALVLVVMPTVVAMYLPLVDFINRSMAQSP